MSESSERRPGTVPPPPPQSVPAPTAPRADAPSFIEEDRAFIGAMRDAGLCSELEDVELDRVIQEVGSRRGVSRRLDILEVYYKAGGDRDAQRRRQAADGFFVHNEREPVTAPLLVRRLALLVPELPEVELSRVGRSDDGPLVLRSGEHTIAVVDDYEEDLETGEIDLRQLDEGPPTISLLGMIRAFNVLLQRNKIRYRFVPLASDASREAYVTTTVAEAMTLCSGGYLEYEDAEDLLDLAGW